MLSNEREQLCFVCFRVGNMHTPKVPSVQWWCAVCDAPIWVPKKIACRTAQNLYSLHRSRPVDARGTLREIAI